MRLDEPKNENYAAVVVDLVAINPLENCDNVVGTPLLGFQAIVGKESQVGQRGIVFPAESQLSAEYASKNNLFRHGNLNEDEGKQGYLEDNARVKAMKFRGHRSDCLFMPLESLQVTGMSMADILRLKPGDTFDQLNGVEICRKYQVKRTTNESKLVKNKEKFVRVDKKFLPEHYKTDNFFRETEVIPDNKIVYVTQKLHGTSVRIANTVVTRRPNRLERLLLKLGLAYYG